MKETFIQAILNQTKKWNKSSNIYALSFHVQKCTTQDLSRLEVVQWGTDGEKKKKKSKGRTHGMKENKNRYKK